MITYDRHGLPHDDSTALVRREPPPDRSLVTTELIGKPRPKYPSPARAPENACPVCWRRLPLLGIWPTCRRCPGYRVAFDRVSRGAAWIDHPTFPDDWDPPSAALVTHPEAT